MGDQQLEYQRTLEHGQERSHDLERTHDYGYDLHHREQARWRRALSLLLTVVLSAVVGAATFAVFLWLYYRGVITLG